MGRAIRRIIAAAGLARAALACPGCTIRRIAVGVGLGVIALACLGLAPPPPPKRVRDSRTILNPRICLWSIDGGPVCVDRPALVRDGDSPPVPQVLIDALLDGPTGVEGERGLYSAIPAGTALHAIHVTGSEYTVQLDLPVRDVGGLTVLTVEQSVRQIGKTLDPVGWRRLAVEATDPRTGEWVPISRLLPSYAVVPKSGVSAALPMVQQADEAVQVGQPPAPGQGQPEGALSGKTVYVSAGHGWQWSDSAWRTQRGAYPTAPYVGPIVEDHNNAEVVNQYLLRYLWNAGAMVWPVRERDMGTACSIVNNDAPGTANEYAEAGAWGDCPGAGYDPEEAGHTCRCVGTVDGSPTARATFTASLPTDGEYAVYVWFRHSDERPDDARYTVHHAGGETTVHVDQTRHGFTWHYIGTYAFKSSEGAVISLDNASETPGRVVTADAVRVGGGTFSDLAGIETVAPYPPDKPWWEVATFYYAQRQGLDPDAWPDFNDVIARPMYARWEHRGTGDDAVFVSWHTNGYSSGYQEDVRGLESYIHSVQPTEGSDMLQDRVHAEILHDIRTGWDATWRDRGKRSADFGELRELWDASPASRMPGVLLEIGFHDNPTDTNALKDPRFAMLAARAVYQGIVKYFEERDRVDLPLLPEPPASFRVANAGQGRVRLAWDPPPVDADDVGGDAATGYRVYVSRDGLGWSNGVAVTSNSHELEGLTPGEIVFFRVSATNAGGESFPTPTLGARVGMPAGVLIVDGFERSDRYGLVPDPDPVEGHNMRMHVAQINNYGYVVHHGTVIDYAFDSATAGAVAHDLVCLEEYQIIDWILGEEAALQQTHTDVSLDSAERDALGAYLENGGALMISGSEIAWDLDEHDLGRSFYREYLKAAYAGDDADTYHVVPAPGSIFDGLGRFDFCAPGEYDADYPDLLSPVGGGTSALAYDGGMGGTAAVQYADGCRRLVNLGFPFETIAPGARALVMERAMGFLDECLAVAPETRIDSPVDGQTYVQVPAFSGMASSAIGLDKVEVSLRRETDGAYWDGATWGTLPWHTAHGTHQWTFTMPVTLAPGTYKAMARAWDTESLSDTTPSEAGFSVVSDSVYLPLVLRTFSGPGISGDELVVNGGFETSDGWEIVSTVYLAGYSTERAHDGVRSMRVGIPPGSSGTGIETYSSVSQTLALPADSAVTLRYWVYPVYQDSDAGDLQYLWLIDEDGNRPILLRERDGDQAWKERDVDLSPYAGQTIHLRFSVMNDGDDFVASTYLDDVRVDVVSEG